jgi:hypothetical protein
MQGPKQQLYRVAVKDCKTLGVLCPSGNIYSYSVAPLLCGLPVDA